jgi:hypothetical protein
MPASGLPTASTTRQAAGSPRALLQRFSDAIGTGLGSRLNKLRVLMLVTVVLGVLFAVLSAFGVNRRDGAIDDVRVAAEQLIALQEVRVAAVRADAVASSSYLVGGLEDPAQRQDYLAQIEASSDGLIEIANGVDSATAVPLATASALLSRYVGLVEQARSNNRQGFPVGAAYQRQANSLMSSDAADQIDIVDSLTAAEAAQRRLVNEGLAEARSASRYVAIPALFLLLALLGGSAWLSRSFQRNVNVPIAIATALLLVILLHGVSSMASAMSSASDAVTGPLTSADLVAQSRSSGYDARSQESLALINRGNGQANEARWSIAANTASNALDLACTSNSSCELSDLFTLYRTAHTELRALDDSGQWDAAVEAVRTAGVADADVTGSFEEFDDASAGQVADNGASASVALATADDGLGSLRALLFIVGLAAAGLAIAGYGQRTREYR